MGRYRTGPLAPFGFPEWLAAYHGKPCDLQSGHPHIQIQIFAGRNAICGQMQTGIQRQRVFYLETTQNKVTHAKK